jgi:hypothetical protein
MLLKPQINHSNILLISLLANKFAVDQSEMGTGKTYVACWLAKQMNKPVVVFCPKSVVLVWKRLLTQYGVPSSQITVVNYELIARGNTKWVKFNHNEYMKKENWKSAGISWNFPNNSFYIFDEAHRCKGADSVNSNLLISAKNSNHSAILLISATLATNVLEMKASGYVMELHKGEDYRKFCQDGGATKNNYGGLSIDYGDDKVKKAILQINDHLFNVKKAASRMTIDMFAGIFPKNHITADVFDMGNNTQKINQIYNEMQFELDRLDERTQNYTAHIFAIIMAARRRTELLKVPFLAEEASDMFYNGVSPVLFLNFSDTIHGIARRLNNNKDLVGKIGFIVGGQKDREDTLKKFEDGVYRVMLVNMGAGAESIGMHDVRGTFPRSSILIPGFSAIRLYQALGRCPRQGGLTPVNQRIVFSAGTIEEVAAEKVQYRLDNLASLNDGDLMSGINIKR